MILEHARPFGVSRWHAFVLGREPRTREKGLVIRVKVRFGAWLGGKEVEADAFVDPGADSTILSWRWAALAREALVQDELERKRALDQEGGVILEDVFVLIGGHPLKLPATASGPRIMSQSPLEPEPGDMPGWEDILLGRDFLAAHKLLLVIDGDEHAFSLLLPDDDENRAARARVMDALNPTTSKRPRKR